MYKKVFVSIFVLIIVQYNCFSGYYDDFIWSKIGESGWYIGKTNGIMYNIAGNGSTTEIRTSLDDGANWEVFFRGEGTGPNYFPSHSYTRIVNKKDSEGIFFHCATNWKHFYAIVYTDFNVKGDLTVYPMDFDVDFFDCDANHNAVAVNSNDSSIYLSIDSMKSWKQVFKDDAFYPANVFIHNANNIGFIATKKIAERKFEHKYFYTTDGGNTWQNTDLTFSRGYNITLDNLEFINDKVGYINGSGYINDVASTRASKDLYSYVLKTTDGGRTWNTLLDSNIIVRDSNSINVMFGMHVYDENTIIVYGWHVYYTQDGGNTWHCFALDYEGKYSGLECAFLDSKRTILAKGGGIGGPAPIGIYKWHKPSSISELPQALSIQVYPNPAETQTTISLDLETASNLTITLTNLLGQELIEVHNGFALAGEFTKTFSILSLPTGVYYLKIVHNGKAKIETLTKQ